jgi:hypothetical protein
MRFGAWGGCVTKVVTQKLSVWPRRDFAGGGQSTGQQIKRLVVRSVTCRPSTAWSDWRRARRRNENGGDVVGFYRCESQDGRVSAATPIARWPGSLRDGEFGQDRRQGPPGRRAGSCQPLTRAFGAANSRGRCRCGFGQGHLPEELLAV